jgi:hypothetical protein
MRIIMRTFFIGILLLISSLTYGQKRTKYTNKDALDYYNQGIIAYNMNSVKLADSLFYKSLKLEATKDCFFNHAMTRLILLDTCTACQDLKVASNFFFDAESKEKYYNICLRKVDTIYYDKKFQKINNSKEYKYFEEYIETKFDSNIYIITHKKNHHSTQTFGADIFNPKVVDIYAFSNIIDSIRFYSFIFSSMFEKNNKERIDSFEEFLTKYLDTKYNFDNIPHRDRYFNVELLINSDGRIYNCNILENPFNLLESTLRNEIESEIKYNILNMPKLIPDRFLGNPVNRIYKFTIGI